ncbi:MAG TPA: helicase-related protein [Polyangiaceae bacterium]
MRVFSRIARDAKAWLDAAPRAEALAELEGRARAASEAVPEARRSDWEKLLAGFAAGEDAKKRRKRVEGLMRACRLFDREERDRERRATPLAWEDPVEQADGVGPTSREKLAAFGVSFAADLVWTLPVGWDDLRTPVGVSEALACAARAEATLAPAPRQCVAGLVKSASMVFMRGRRGVRVVVADAASPKTSLDAWWFFVAHGVLALAREGAPCLLVGRVRLRAGKRPMLAHPDFLRDEPSTRAIRPRYPSLGMTPGMLRRAVSDAVARVTPPPDPVPSAIVERETMPEAAPLLRVVHGASFDAPPDAARRALADRLGWVEAFTRVWQRLLADGAGGKGKAPVLRRDEGVAARFADALGFPLTGAQKRAIDAVARDLESPLPMRRLLLGDVGTGKTAVALAAAAQCVAAGFQCALLVPTGVLADQYMDAAAPLVKAMGARVERVVAGMRAAERRAALEAVASGAAHVVVGTHALLQEDVAFARVGLVVVDEQQRLGVAQRLTLVRRGDGVRPHLLSLSATPIPRTMALALRGELATSLLDERPRGRAPVETRLCPRSSAASWLEAMRAACTRGERAFFVCPRIDDDEEEEELGAVAHAERLTRELAPARVAVVHGAMPPAERARAMRAFRRGEAQVLVGTTVVEVGIDVPEATLMVVDAAERFGLAQLHQLRGRVGRGERPGCCVLVHDEPLQDLAHRRLQTLAATSDGGAIARADLELRGAGDLGGTRQSGIVEDFTWLDPREPPAWVERVDGDARAILARDPKLEAPEHRALALAVRRFAVAIAVREEAG